MSETNNLATSAAPYTLVDINNEILDLFNQSKINDLRNALSLQIQGSSVIIPNIIPAALAAIIFSVAFDTALEVVIKVEKNKSFRIFNHHGEFTVLDDSPVIDNEACVELKKIIEKTLSISDMAGAQPVFSLNIEELWKQAIASNFSFDKSVMLFIDSITKLREPAHRLFLSGEVEALPVFLTLYLTRPLSQHIYFVNDAGKEFIIFSKNQ